MFIVLCSLILNDLEVDKKLAKANFLCIKLVFTYLFKVPKYVTYKIQHKRE